MATRRDDLRDTREKILAATLNHVPFDGWSLASLQRGAADAGLDDAAALRAFPRGASQVVTPRRHGFPPRVGRPHDRWIALMPLAVNKGECLTFVRTVSSHACSLPVIVAG